MNVKEPKYTVNKRTQSGNGPSDRIEWEIVSEKYIDERSIGEIIEKTYPSAGYGATSHSVCYHDRIDKKWKVSCTSWASAD